MSVAVVSAITLSAIAIAQDDAEPIAEPMDYLGAAQPDMQQTETSTSQYYLDNDSEQPPDTDLETGLPRSVLLTPLRWGRLSLVSFTAYEGYNSNPDFNKVPLGATLTTTSALAVYSALVAGWRLDMQYQPFMVVSSRATFKDFAAASFDLRKGHRISPSWSWTASERLRYAPTHATTEQKGFVFDPNGGISIGNAFLSSGRNVLVNGGTWVLTDRYNENSSFAFHASHNFIRLSSYVGSKSTDLPAEEVLSYSTGVTWRDHYNQRDTVSLKYVFRAQNSLGTGVSDVNAHTASFGWSRQLMRGAAFSVTFGPGWSIYTGGQNPGATNRGRATLHGSVTLSKHFYRGGMVLAFARSNGFSGVISDNFNNRYDIAVQQALTSRLHCSASASYLQQQVTSRPGTNGRLASAEVSYLLSHNWAIFGQVRYLDVVGGERIGAPEKTAILGFRWSWVPEKP